MDALSAAEVAGKVFYIFGLFAVGGASLYTAWKFLPPLIAVANRLTTVAGDIPAALADRDRMALDAAETRATVQAIAEHLGVKVPRS